MHGRLVLLDYSTKGTPLSYPPTSTTESHISYISPIRACGRNLLLRACNARAATWADFRSAIDFLVAAWARFEVRRLWFGGLGRLVVRADRSENLACSLLDSFKRAGKRLCFTVVELDVVSRRAVRIKPDVLLRVLKYLCQCRTCRPHIKVRVLLVPNRTYRCALNDNPHSKSASLEEGLNLRDGTSLTRLGHACELNYYRLSSF